MRRVGPLALVFVVLLGVGMATVAVAAGDDLDASQPTQQVEQQASGEFEYDAIGDELASLADVDTEAEPDVSQEAREAAETGAREGVEQAQRQGVDVSQAQEEAAVDSAVHAAAQYQDASVEQIQAAARGATHGAVLQSQQANATQLQSGVYGSAAGSLSQFQEANVTQIQSAAYGAAHGTVAQHQEANVTQLQYAAVGASAGATHGAAQFQSVNVTQIQESAQGSAYGSLTRIQEVRVEQIQAAAFGAAGGGADGPAHDPKKAQEASMGAAKGAITQSQEADVAQIQAAARGACKGALTQSQEVSVTQIQEAVSGAAQGAISQHQEANVRQIQAAANGGARGTLTQIQTVEIVQIQTAALGSARGAARSAAQNQVVDVEQIQAAAAGAGQGALVQVQQINVVQIQVITESAAAGALSQHQEASVTQIQSAARGASEGTISVSQRQEITIERIQTRTQRAAATTVRNAIEINVQQEITIINYARGAAGDPDPPDDLQSLFVSVEDDAIFLANPNDRAVTVTITSEDEGLQTVTLSPGESTTETLSPGTYTITAEAEDGRDVELSGRASISVSIGPDLQSLDATVDGRTLTVDNPNGQRVTVTAHSPDAPTRTVDVPANWDEEVRLDPGTYTLTAEADDGRPVPINGEDAHEITVEDPTIRLDASVSEGTITVDNPSDADVTARATDEAGEETEIQVSAGATESRDLDPGNYTLTAEADGREVLVDDQPTFEFSIEGEEPGPPVDLSVTVENQTVTIDSPSDVEITVTATAEDGREEELVVSDAETIERQFDPGTWTFTGEAEDDRNVTINGDDAHTVDVEEEPAPPEDLDVTVDNQTVTIDNPSEVDVTVTATPDVGDAIEIDVPAERTVSEDLQPGNHTLTATAEDRNVTLNGQEEFGIEVEEEPLEAIDLDVTVENRTVTIENPGEDEVTVSAAADDGTERQVVVPADRTVTEEFEPGNYTLTAATEVDREVTIDGEEVFSIEIEEEPLEPIDLNVSAENETVEIENPSDAEVTVTAIAEDGTERQISPFVGENVSETLDPGTWTLTATSEVDRQVTLNGQDEFTVEIEAPPVDLNVTAEAGNVSIDNPGDAATTVTASPETVGDDRIVEVPANETVTRDLDPGTYTLTAEAADDREVLIDGSERTTITVEETGPDRQLDTCTAITEPGRYELTGDLRSDDPSTCLRIESSDVVLAGNGNAIEGPGANVDGQDGYAGVHVGPVDGTPVENVTVFDVNASGWDAGVRVNESDAASVSDVTVESTTASDNRDGIRAEATDVELLDVRATENVRDGLNFTDEAQAHVESSNLTRNGGDGVAGLDAAEATVVTSAIEDNDGAGIGFDGDDTALETTEVAVRNNGGSGVVAGGTATLQGTTLADDVGLELDAREGTATATDLGVGPAATVDATDLSLGLDHVAQGALPAVPDDANAVGSGLNVTDLDGTADVRLEYQADPADDEVELWRHDGVEWAPVPAERTPEGRLEATIEEAGIYAPVSPPAEEPTIDATVGNRAVWAQNPTDQPLLATVSNGSGEVETLSVDPGRNESFEGLDPGQYTLTAATAEGDEALVDGQPDLQFSLPPDLESLSLSPSGEEVTANNPNGLPVDLIVSNGSGIVTTPTLGPGESATLTAEDLLPGEYDAAAETDEGQSVPVDGEWTAPFTIEASATALAPTPEPTTESTPTPGQEPTPTPGPTPTADGDQTPPEDEPEPDANETSTGGS